MKAAESLIQESALYQSITLKSGAEAACTVTMGLINQNNLLHTIHPIIISQAAPFLSQI